MDNLKNLLTVTFDDISGKYNVSISQGSTVEETIFAMSVVIKCFVRDGVVEKPEELVELLKKYLSDPQYEEVDDEKEEEDESV
jgi:hypothetical protein